MDLFLLPKEQRCRLVSLLLSAAKIDRDAGGVSSTIPNSSYMYMYLCILQRVAIVSERWLLRPTVPQRLQRRHRLDAVIAGRKPNARDAASAWWLHVSTGTLKYLLPWNTLIFKHEIDHATVTRRLSTTGRRVLRRSKLHFLARTLKLASGFQSLRSPCCVSITKNTSLP